MIDQLAPTAISQFIRLDACRRFLYFTLHPGTTAELRERYGARPRPLSPLLKQAGERFEADVTAALRADHEVIDLADRDTSATVAALRQVGRTPVILAQAALEGTIGSWRSAGRADLIEAIRDKRGRLHVLIADVKASREERLEHRVQVATYALLLTDLCRREDLPLIRIVGAVVHRTPSGPFKTLHDPALHFELGPYQTLVLDLIAKEDGALNRVAQSPLEELPFALSALCDGCPFNSICLPHAAERADLALVPDVSRATRSALQAHAIGDLRALAALKEPDAAGVLQPAPGQTDRIALLLRDPVVAPQLDHLVARARAVLRRLDPTIRAPSRLPDFQSSPLPDPAAKPHLIQICLDFQADDVTGDLYLAAALVQTAQAERIVTRMSAAPPTTEIEADLLLAWAIDLEAAIRELATDDAPPLHVLVYDRRAQRIALEACARHEQRHALLGVLVAWLQERPQIERATCARLRDVIGQQRNLRLTCDSLYAVAAEVWDQHNQRFSWKTPEHDFTRLFRAGLFDNLQRFVRTGDGLRAASPLAQESFSLEAVSRFSSQIPSEYAYAIWNGVEHKPGRAELLAFAEHRLRALVHLANACRRQRNLDVPLLPLDQLPAAAGPRDLRSALIEFLELEYTAALADLLAHVRLPIARRVLTGRTALLEAIAVEPKGEPPLARFRFAATPGGGAVPPRFKVGDWAVLNEAVDGLSPWEIIKGRLVIISAIDEETIEVELTSLSSAGRFKFHHDAKLQVQIRCRYTLDEMADDLLADKVRAALDHLATNPLARWLQAAQAPTPAALDDSTLAEAAAALIALHAPATPTEAQRQVIATGGQLPLRLVQGPPGSGKSRTLGLAVVARLLAAAIQGQTLRVAVTAKTHSAVQVALDSIAKAWQQWCAAPDQAPLLPLADLPIVKLGGSSVAPRASGVRWADPRKGAKDLRALIGGAVVVGGTPGGLSALLETTQRKARWDGLFDLLLIDEASQMSLPEGLLAASVLHEHGQMIVVGDHRQMPPIITHTWAEAAGSLAAWAPERSLFKWLLDAAAPCVALDESFRLHRDHARFLHQAIYHADGIAFHSRRTDLLPPHAFADPFIAAALRWDVPLVVIEHTERDSRQSNPLEALIVADLVRACLELGLDGRDGIGVVVPHRAQKAALRAQLPELAAADSVDTVERFQGGERDVIIVACTASDPDYVSAEAEFLLDPQRLNVALSRARKKLIVVAAASVFGALPIDLPIFERAALWKRLYNHAAPYPLWQGSRYEHRIRVLGPAAKNDD